MFLYLIHVIAIFTFHIKNASENIIEIREISNENKERSWCLWNYNYDMTQGTSNSANINDKCRTHARENVFIEGTVSLYRESETFHWPLLSHPDAVNSLIIDGSYTRSISHLQWSLGHSAHLKNVLSSIYDADQ
eukprot:NODE_265_length_11346_cov_0.635814.p7 type:complete len:134 gc:universal NODE_265_length_11346_cov_0.635814:2703-3104(+)